MQKYSQYQTDSHKTRRCGQRVRTKVRQRTRSRVGAVASAGVAGAIPHKADKADTITNRCPPWRFRVDSRILHRWEIPKIQCRTPPPGPGTRPHGRITSPSAPGPGQTTGPYSSLCRLGTRRWRRFLMQAAPTGLPVVRRHQETCTPLPRPLSALGTSIPRRASAGGLVRSGFRRCESGPPRWLTSR